jgi:hypothetical protein
MRIQKILKTTLRTALILLAIFAVGLAGVALYLRTSFDIEKLRPTLERQFSDLLKRPVTIKSLEWTWVPKPTLTALQIEIKDTDGSALYEAPKTDAIINLRALWLRQLRIWKVIMTEPTLSIRQHADGRVNLADLQKDISNQNDANETKNSFFSFALRHVLIENGTILIYDDRLHPPKLRTHLAVNATLDIPTKGPLVAQFNARVMARGRNGQIKGSATFPDPVVIKAGFNDLPLTTFADYIPFLSTWSGNIKAELSYLVKDDKASWHLNGDLKNVAHPGISEKTTMSGTFKLSDDVPLSATLNLNSPGSDGAISLTWNVASSTMNVAARFEKLNLDDLLAIGDKFPATGVMAPLASTDTKKSSPMTIKMSLSLNKVHTPWAEAGRLLSTMTWRTDSRAHATIDITRLAAANERIHLVKSSMTYQNGELRFDPVLFQGLGGTGTASIALKPPASTTTAAAFGTFDVRWNMVGFDALKLQRAMQSSEKISGRLNSWGSLNGAMNPFDWRTVNGLVAFRLSTGSITGMPGVVKVLTALNLHSLFRTIGGANQPGIDFHVIRSTMSVVNGVFITSAPFVLRGDTLSVWSRGSLSMPDNKLNLNVVIQPLTLVDEVLKAIPGVRTILLGKRKTLVPIYAKVTGSPNDPKVDIQPLKSLEKKVWRTVLGVFQLPENILKTIFSSDKTKTPAD